MNILIDTHIALWALYDDSKLTEFAVQYLIDSNNTIFYSLISAWEIEIKHSLGKLNVPSDAFIHDCESMGFKNISIRKEHLLGLKALPYPDNGHKDPFDRLLIATANIENMGFLTQDHKLQVYHERCILPGLQ